MVKRMVAAFVGLVVATAIHAQPSVGKDVLVSTLKGALMGETVGENHDVQAFRGIPFALPPVGNRRWKAPEDMPVWAGIRDAKHFSPACMQPYMTDMTNPPRDPVSEDCLYLNVWTPGKAGDKLPVMFWIPGGGFVVGSNSKPSANGANLAKKGVVVVSLNYRLGILGYMAHPELTAESPHKASGNYGALDQVAALRWVQENIAAFGGDPDNVTIFGVSAAARSVGYLMGTPLSAGLFHKAIAQSGAYMFPMSQLDKPGYGKPSAHDMGLMFQKRAGAKSLAELRDMPAEALISAAGTALDMWRADAERRFRPEVVVDGWVFPDEVFNRFKEGKQHDVPVILGFNKDEASSFVISRQVPPLPATAAEYEAEVHKRFGDLAEEYLSVYSSGDIIDSVFRATRDGVYAWALETWANATEKVSSDAYIYFFAHEPVAGDVPIIVPGTTGWTKRNGVHHGAEVPYVFNNLSALDGFNLLKDRKDKQAGASDVKMADIVSDYWVSFAKTGKPVAKGQPEWKTYHPAEQNYLMFEKASASLKQDLAPGAWEIYEKIYARRRAQNTGGLLWEYMGSTSLYSPPLPAQ